VTFHLSCVPPTSSHHAKTIVRVRGFARIADKPALVAAKEMLDVLLLPHRPPAPLEGPLTLALTFTWPWAKSATKKLRALGRAPRASRPDCSNLAKTTEDRLVAMRFLQDDGQVVRLVVEKYWGDEAGITVSIEPWRAQLPVVVVESAEQALEAMR
jgi:Holliday junction resolvase RusA-like endonuclease